MHMCVWFLALSGGISRAEDSSVRYAPAAAETEGPEGGGTQTGLGKAAVQLGKVVIKINNLKANFVTPCMHILSLTSLLGAH